MAKSFLPEGHKKNRTLSGEMKLNTISEGKYPGYKIKSGMPPRSKFSKPRPKSIMIEKEQLYDENMQLKMLSNGLLEENIKLKTRLQQSENDLKKNVEKGSDKEFKGSNIVMKLKEKVKDQKESIGKVTAELNELKISIRATRVVELEEEAKQYFNECWRLKKILEDSAKTEKRTPKELKSEENTGFFAEKIKNLEARVQLLTSENKAQKALLESQTSEIKSLKAKISAFEDKSPPESPEKALPVITIQKDLQRAVTTKFSDPSRELKRELGSNTDVILDSFFHKLSMQISNKYLKVEDFILQIDPKGKVDLNMQELYENLTKNGFIYSVNELTAVYEIFAGRLGTNTISTKAISEKLRAEDMDSNKSYDISSESSRSNSVLPVAPKALHINQVEFEEIQPVFEFLYVFVSYQKLDKGKVLGILRNKLPDHVDLSVLASLFLDKTLRIEDGVERNKVCSFLVGPNKTISKSEAIDKIIQLIFEYDLTENEKSEKLIEVLSEIQEKNDAFLEACKAKDINEKDFLSWRAIEEVLNDLGIETDRIGLLQLKVKCYGIEKSLNIIPYKEILN